MNIWNTNKQGGWEAYKSLTQDMNEFQKAISDKKTNTENVRDIEKILTKKKFASFGKIKRKIKNYKLCTKLKVLKWKQKSLQMK